MSSETYAYIYICVCGPVVAVQSGDLFGKGCGFIEASFGPSTGSWYTLGLIEDGERSPLRLHSGPCKIMC